MDSLLGVLWLLIVVFAFPVIAILSSRNKSLDSDENKIQEKIPPLPKPPKMLKVNNIEYTEYPLPYPGFYDESKVYFFQDHPDGRYWYKINNDGYPQLHRFNGPAVEYKDGLKQYFLFNVHYTFENYKKELQGSLTSFQIRLLGQKHLDTGAV